MEHTLALIGRAHQGDKAARDTLFKENEGLIYSVARRFLGRGVEMEDLFQIGSIGLLKAIDKFDETYMVKFSTYAVPLRKIITMFTSAKNSWRYFMAGSLL